MYSCTDYGPHKNAQMRQQVPTSAHPAMSELALGCVYFKKSKKTLFKNLHKDILRATSSSGHIHSLLKAVPIPFSGATKAIKEHDLQGSGRMYTLLNVSKHDPHLRG